MKTKNNPKKRPNRALHPASCAVADMLDELDVSVSHLLSVTNQLRELAAKGKMAGRNGSWDLKSASMPIIFFGALSLELNGVIGKDERFNAIGRLLHDSVDWLIGRGIDQEKMHSMLIYDAILMISCLGYHTTGANYHIEPELADALRDSTGDNLVLDPAAFSRLPEMSLYLDARDCGMSWGGYAADGFILTQTANFMPDDDQYHFTLAIVAVHNGIATKLATIVPTGQTLSELVATFDAKQGGITSLEVRALLGIVLYLCSSEPLIEPRKTITCSYSSPTKKAVNLVAATAPRHFDINKPFSASYKAFFAAESSGFGAKKRPHVRRGHWHGYHKNIEGELQLYHKWLPPIFVNAQLEGRKKQ